MQKFKQNFVSDFKNNILITKILILVSDNIKGDILLRPLKLKFQTVIFAIIIVTMDGQTYKLFKNIFNDVQTEGKGEIAKITVQQFDFFTNNF